MGDESVCQEDKGTRGREKSMRNLVFVMEKKQENFGQIQLIVEEKKF